MIRHVTLDSRRLQSFLVFCHCQKFGVDASSTLVAHLILSEFILTGVTGASRGLVLVFPMAFTMSMPLTTLPNTGCCDGVDLSNQSRKELCTVLTKNWDPPLLGWPVLAMDRVPGSLEVLSTSSSGMLPVSVK